MTKAEMRNQVAEIAAQIGSELMPDNDQWVNRFTVRSDTKDAVYVVAQRRSDGTWGCGCWAWKRHRRCKHLGRILERLAAVPQRAYFEPSTIVMLSKARLAHLDFEAKPVQLNAAKRRVLDL